MNREMLKKIVKQEILKEMGTKLQGTTFDKQTHKYGNDEGFRAVKKVNSIIVSIEENLDDLESVIGEYAQDNKRIKQIRMILDKLNEEYGMDEQDFGRHFGG